MIQSFEEKNDWKTKKMESSSGFASFSPENEWRETNFKWLIFFFFRNRDYEYDWNIFLQDYFPFIQVYCTSCHSGEKEYISSNLS